MKIVAEMRLNTFLFNFFITGVCKHYSSLFMVADDLDNKIELKPFHSEILNNLKHIKMNKIARKILK